MTACAIYGLRNKFYLITTVLFIPAVFFDGGGAIPPPKKKTYKSPRRLPNSVLKVFFQAGIEITNVSRKLFLMDNKHEKLFVTKQSKGCKFMPKMHQNTFGGRAPPDHLAAMGIYFYNRGPLIREGRWGEGREKRGDGGGGNSPPKSRWVE